MTRDQAGKQRRDQPTRKLLDDEPASIGRSTHDASTCDNVSDEIAFAHFEDIGASIDRNEGSDVAEPEAG